MNTARSNPIINGTPGKKNNGKDDILNNNNNNHNNTPKRRGISVTSSECSIGQPVIDAWTSISYKIFESVSNDDNTKNTFICVPQLISNIALLISVSHPVPSAALRKELMNEKDHLQEITAAQTWEQKIQSAVKPGSFCEARRVLVHHKFAKSYAYATFIGLNALGVELKICEEQMEVATWLQQVLKINFVTSNPFKLWRSGEPSSLKKDIRLGMQEHSPKENQIKSNQKCPIMAWASHFQISFKANLLDSESVFVIDSDPNHEQLLLRLRADKATMKKTNIGKAEIVEIPSSTPSIMIYIISHLDKSSDGETVIELINKVQQADYSLKTVYLPAWLHAKKHITNMAKAIKTSLDADALFSHSGLGDLGTEDSEASAEYTKRITSNIQHFDLVTILHAPDPEMSPDKITTPLESSDLLISVPYLLVICHVEETKKMPFYFCRISDAQMINRIIDAEKDKQKLNIKKRCTII